MEQHITPNETPKEQAAQLSDKQSTIDALAGGTTSPRPPYEPQRLPSLSRERARKKKNNKIDFRADSETVDRIYDRVAETGCSVAEAIRQLIEDGATRSPRIILTPITPPEPLEEFIGALAGWRRDLVSVRSRLNAPLPRNQEDLALLEQVQTWRQKSKDLITEIDHLLESARFVHGNLTSITPEKLASIYALVPSLIHFKRGFEATIKTKGESPAQLKSLRMICDILTLLKELGIKQD